MPAQLVVDSTGCKMSHPPDTAQLFIIINKNFIFGISFSMAFYLLYREKTKQVVLVVVK